MTNPIASILLHVEPSPRCAMRIGVAAQLAQRLDASVTVLYPAAPVPSMGRGFLAEGQGQGLVLAPAPDAERRAQARALSDAVQPGPRVRWSETDPNRPLVPAFVRQALLHDLVVMGQHARRRQPHRAAGHDGAGAAGALNQARQRTYRRAFSGARRNCRILGHGSPSPMGSTVYSRCFQAPHRVVHRSWGKPLVSVRRMGARTVHSKAALSSPQNENGLQRFRCKPYRLVFWWALSDSNTRPTD